MTEKITQKERKAIVKEAMKASTDAREMNVRIQTLIEKSKSISKDVEALATVSDDVYERLQDLDVRLLNLEESIEKLEARTTSREGFRRTRRTAKLDKNFAILSGCIVVIVFILAIACMSLIAETTAIGIICCAIIAIAIGIIVYEIKGIKDKGGDDR